MTRGISLSRDLKLLVNNQRYSDIEILCEDGVKLYACRALLAARSEIFDGLLYNGMRESFDDKISFPEINSSVMEIVLEFLYTGCDVKDYLTHDNIIEIYHAADYFQMFDLRNSIIRIVKEILNLNPKQSCAPELLTRAVTKMSASADCEFMDLLVESVAKIHLESIGPDRFSFKALLCLLSHTQDNKMVSFATPEYSSMDKISSHPIQVDTIDDPKFVEIRQQLVQMFNPLLDYIDLWRIDAQILEEIIEPLEIIPLQVMFQVYRQKARINKTPPSDTTRGIPYIYIEDSTEYVWDKNFCGSQLIVGDVERSIITTMSECANNQSARAKIAISDRGQYEWDIFIESMCKNIWIGVMSDDEDFDYNKPAGEQPNGWVYGSQGVCSNNKVNIKYGSSFTTGDKITVHLNMNSRTCVFSVNGKRQSQYPAWENLPSKLYPVASFSYPGRIRIQAPKPREIYELD